MMRLASASVGALSFVALPASDSKNPVVMLVTNRWRPAVKYQLTYFKAHGHEPLFRGRFRVVEHLSVAEILYAGGKSRRACPAYFRLPTADSVALYQGLQRGGS